MSRTIPGGAQRKNVVCSNEECPGGPWTGQRKAHRATEEPCPRCSSAVVVVDGPPRPESAIEQPPAVPAAAPPLRSPYIGRPTSSCPGPVRYGLGAKQRLDELHRRPEHRHKTLPELVGWALDQWGAGL